MFEIKKQHSFHVEPANMYFQFFILESILLMTFETVWGAFINSLNVSLITPSPFRGFVAKGFTWSITNLVLPTGSAFSKVPNRVAWDSCTFFRQLGFQMTFLGLPLKKGRSSAQNVCLCPSPGDSMITLKWNRKWICIRNGQRMINSTYWQIILILIQFSKSEGLMGEKSKPKLGLLILHVQDF